MTRSKKQIEKDIKEIEEEITRVTQFSTFGNPVFSEWYCTKVAEIDKLQKELKENA